eukprot:SAG11_NODE_4002_length_2112_cov_4.740841_1_plen_127_part_00
MLQHLQIARRAVVVFGSSNPYGSLLSHNEYRLQIHVFERIPTALWLEFIVFLPLFGVPLGVVQADWLLTVECAVVWLVMLLYYTELRPICSHLEEVTPTFIFSTLGLIHVNLLAWEGWHGAKHCTL